jgi:hypothetical protein
MVRKLDTHSPSIRMGRSAPMFLEALTHSRNVANRGLTIYVCALMFERHGRGCRIGEGATICCASWDRPRRRLRARREVLGNQQEERREMHHMWRTNRSGSPALVAEIVARPMGRLLRPVWAPNPSLVESAVKRPAQRCMSG